MDSYRITILLLDKALLQLGEELIEVRATRMEIARSLAVLQLNRDKPNIKYSYVKVDKTEKLVDGEYIGVDKDYSVKEPPKKRKNKS